MSSRGKYASGAWRDDLKRRKPKGRPNNGLIPFIPD